jgi:hypothetical protein
MEPIEYLAIVISIFTILGGIAGSIRWMVKHYLNELRPNGGTSMKDSLERMEIRIDDLYKLIADK